MKDLVVIYYCGIRIRSESPDRKSQQRPTARMLRSEYQDITAKRQSRPMMIIARVEHCPVRGVMYRPGKVTSMSL